MANNKILKSMISMAVSSAREVFCRQISKLAKSLSLIVLDGPLPVGDLLSLGGAIWVAHDIEKRRKKYKTWKNILKYGILFTRGDKI